MTRTSPEHSKHHRTGFQVTGLGSKSQGRDYKSHGLVSKSLGQGSKSQRWKTLVSTKERMERTLTCATAKRGSDDILRAIGCVGKLM